VTITVILPFFLSHLQMNYLQRSLEPIARKLVNGRSKQQLLRDVTTDREEERLRSIEMNLSPSKAEKYMHGSTCIVDQYALVSAISAATASGTVNKTSASKAVKVVMAATDSFQTRVDFSQYFPPISSAYASSLFQPSSPKVDDASGSTVTSPQLQQLQQQKLGDLATDSNPHPKIATAMEGTSDAISNDGQGEPIISSTNSSPSKAVLTLPPPPPRTLPLAFSDSIASMTCKLLMGRNVRGKRITTQVSSVVAAVPVLLRKFIFARIDIVDTINSNGCATVSCILQIRMSVLYFGERELRHIPDQESDKRDYLPETKVSHVLLHLHPMYSAPWNIAPKV
jgi:hypothetical protein